MKSFVFIIIALASSKSLATDLKDNLLSPPPVPLDTHFHYFTSQDRFLGDEAGCEKQTPNCEPDRGFQDFLKSNRVEKAFLLSSSWSIEAENQRDRTLNDVSLIDKHVSEIVTQSPNRFIGFCGLNFTWSTDFAKRTLEKCLTLPGMKGIKIHISSDLDLTSKVVLSMLDSVFHTIDKFRPVILWHLPLIENNHILELKDALEKPNNEVVSINLNGEKIKIDEIELKNQQEVTKLILNKLLKRNKETIDNLLFLVSSHPKITFVIAHSLRSIDGFEQINQTEKKQGHIFKNLYVEISVVNAGFQKPIQFEKDKNGKVLILDNIDTEGLKLFEEQMRIFGLDRVLYGSDNSWIQPGEEKFKDLFSFSKKEIDLILYINGRKFLNKISRHEQKKL